MNESITKLFGEQLNTHSQEIITRSRRVKF